MVAMTTLRRANNGDWFGRKAIPADVRDAYKLAYGVSREERFRLSSTTSQGQAKAEFRDWDATVSSRIEALRASGSGSSVSLTARQISALSGEWYQWYVSQHEEEPGQAEDWDSRYEMLGQARARFLGSDAIHDDIDAGESPVVRRHVRACVIELAKLPTFLADKALTLAEETYAAFVDVIEDELIASFALLRRRAGGDYTPDERLSKFANSDALVANRNVKLAGMDCWQAFEAWVKERQPAASTVGRWRGVFIALNDHFEKRDVATITDEDAIAWKGSLVTAERSAQVANDVWITAAGTIFKWLLDNKKVRANPFAGVRVATAKKVKRRERAFEPTEWKAILKAALAPPTARVKKQKAAARRWVPWLCAYTGSRPGEMTQLQGSHVYEQDGIWIINITPEGGGTVKGASFRKVPIHEHLIALGFLDFVKETGTGPLFYDPADHRAESKDPTKPVRPPYVITRQKLAEWVRQNVGVTDPDISPNHAWRHTFKRQAARVGMERRFRFAFCGHESDEVGDIYETPTLEDMAEALKTFPRYDLE
ncbi:hypothetical protein [Sinorhizobium terangae]|uniref:hypothetical protein n=1 Tax=Sinorhizobium terangae TaxID=110322 RepID=UPI0024B2821D|nr:hypothetical protein [Sinorhizobium terangae]WFU49026.1 hypothetical protein QA637_06380 [Sinorhizobium terangae]